MSVKKCIKLDDDGKIFKSTTPGFLNAGSLKQALAALAKYAAELEEKEEAERKIQLGKYGR